MIVHGEKDIIVPPRNAALIKERIRNAELFMIPEAGHNYPAADPVGIHQRITTWLRHSARAGSSAYKAHGAPPQTLFALTS